MIPTRNAVTAVVLAFVVGLILGAIAASAWPRPVVSVTSPTPTPTPTATATLTPETPSPSPSPTVTPTPAPTDAPPPPRTPRPQPTTRAAGEQLYPYYFQVRRLFPIFPPTPQIDFDFPADDFGDAIFRGLNPAGQPIFSVREDFVMTPRTAFHEIGHAYEELLKHKNAGVDWRAKYWAFRGFPDTWQAAAADAATKTGMAQWVIQPQESWAEAFSVAMVGGGQEKTQNFGRTLDPIATRAFFISLMN